MKLLVKTQLFGPKCPIRRNLELLKTDLGASDCYPLLELCDHNGLHIPIRQILLLLANAVLGHPDVRDHLMVAADVPRIISAGTVSRASLYNNIFAIIPRDSSRRRDGVRLPRTISDRPRNFKSEKSITFSFSERATNTLVATSTNSSLK